VYICSAADLETQPMVNSTGERFVH